MTSRDRNDRRTDLEPYLDHDEGEAEIRPGTAQRLLVAMLKHPRLVAAGGVCVVAGAAAGLLEPRLFGYAIDDAIVPKDWNRLVELSLAFLGLIVMAAAAMVGEAYLFESLGQAVMQDLRLAVFSKLTRLPMSAYDRNPAGRLMTRVTNDVVALGEIFSAGFVTMIGNALLVAGILVWLLVLNLRLGLIAAAVFPFMLIATGYFSERLRRSYRDARSKLSALNAFLAENLMGIRTIHLFNRERRHLERFTRLTQRYTDAQIATIRNYAYLQPTITLAAGTSMALVIWFGGNAARDGTIPIGVLVTYFAYAVALFRPMRDIADKWNVLLSGMASAERIFAVLDWTTELPDDAIEATPVPYADLHGEIVFDHVWFAYDDDRWVLRDVNVTIPAGARVGIVGHTGSGKTTMIALLLRFYEPQRGRILLDGKDLREYDRRRLRASIGLVQQDGFLFSGTIGDNISLIRRGRSGAAQGGVELPAERLVSERGSNLSAGERQLIAFARARATHPRIWILDEATSNMDSFNEARLQAELAAASRERTAILIAHRLATTRGCDTVLVLNKGELVESGNHTALMAENGLYARLFRYQQLATD